MFQKHIYNPGNTYVSTIRLVRHEAADATYNQFNLHTLLAGIVKLIDHVLVVQSVHLQNNLSLSALINMLYFAAYHFSKGRYHIESGYQ